MTIQQRKISKTLFLCSLLLVSHITFAKPIDKNTARDNLRAVDQVVNTVIWQQSAEAKAMYYQTFNLARWRLEQTLRTYKSNKLPAIVLDIDETVLDNSPYAAANIIHKQHFPQGWSGWVKAAKAKPLPGALDFLNYANSQNVTIFYVTNRTLDQKDDTIKNLKALGFPQLKDSHLMFKHKEGSKEDRRQTISATYEIIMLIGDQLTDLSSVFDNAPLAKRNNEVNKLRDSFGDKYILLPNPTYGAWLDVITDYRYDIPVKTMLDKRLQTLKTN